MMSYQPSSYNMDRRNVINFPQKYPHQQNFTSTLSRGGVIVVSSGRGGDVVSSDQSTSSSSSSSMCGTHHQRCHPTVRTTKTTSSYNLNQPHTSDIPTIFSAGIPVVRIPSTHLAFRSSRVPPPLPPKSEAMRIRTEELSTDITSTKPISILPSSTETCPVSPPIPKPRLSKMKSMTELPTGNEINENGCAPVPKPRRLTSDSDNSWQTKQAVPKLSAKPCQGLTRCSVASVKRRSGAHRPATPILQVSEPDIQSTSTTNIMDESERQYLEEAVRQTYSEDTSDSEDSEGSAPYGQILRFPRKAPSLPSPTTDSGLPHSDYDDKRQPGSERSTDDGFFDASQAKRDDDDDQSENLTSISNQKPNDTPVNEEARGRGLSLLEKNARVMRWIQNAEE